MTLKERALNLIGLERMTNRDQLIEELAELEGEALYDALVDNRLVQRIDELRYEDCHRLHGGMCPRPEDDAECVLSLEDWMGTPCERERLLPEDLTDG